MKLENIIYCGDNLIWLKQFPKKCIDLIYLDPPFFSNRYYEIIFNDGEEIRSFQDRWKGGINHYIEWMKERVFELHRVLKDTGSFYLHCDWHASHYLKVMCDDIFGYNNFKNEIVWRRTGTHGKSKRYSPVHDVILFYSKSDKYTWNYPKKPYMKGHVEEYFIKDEKGWRTNYYGNVLTGSGIRKGESGKAWKGFNPTQKGRHWAIPKSLYEDLDDNFSRLSTLQKLDKLYDLGFIKIVKGQAWPIYERYLKPNDGQPVTDIWAYQPYTNGLLFNTNEGIDEDVRWMSPKDQERLGYPTQKPESLMERIIKTSSNKNDLVLDPFCGCGTTIAIAQRLQRKWVGIDVSPSACKLMRNRVEKNGARGIEIVGLPVNIDELKALPPFEFQNWCVGALGGTINPKKVGDMGIDGFTFFNRYPIQVKQSENVGRNVVDNFETALQRDKKDRGYIIALSFGKGAYEEVARVKKEGLFIELLTVDKLLGFSEEKVSDKMFEFY